MRLFSAEIDMFCCDQKRVSQSEQTATSQRKAARKIGQLFCDDVSFFSSFCKTSVSLSCTTRLSAFVENDRILSIRVLVVLVPTRLVPFVVYHDFFVFQPPHLFACEVPADCFFAFAH